MNIQISNKVLLPELAKLCSLVKPSDTLFVTNVILGRVEPGKKLSLTSTSVDFEMTSTVSEFTSDEDGSFLLPARKLFDICQKTTDDAAIKIAIKGDKAKVATPGANYQLNVMSADEFPLMQDSSPEMEIQLRQDDIKFLFDKVASSMADADVMSVLNGALFAIREGGLEVVATDRHRLAVAQIDNEHNVAEQSMILPRKAVSELQKLLNYDDNIVKIRSNERFFEMVIGDTIIKAKLLEGEYPDYRKVIPSDFTQSVSVDAAVFKQTLARACVLIQGEKKTANVKLSFDGKQMKVSAANQEGENVEAVQELESEVKPVDVAFNPQYLNDVLSSASASHIIFDIKDSNSGVLLREQGIDTVKYVIMPIRL